MSARYALLLAVTIAAGFAALFTVGMKAKGCKDCHCQTGGMCCCGNYCTPDCECANCNCKE